MGIIDWIKGHKKTAAAIGTAAAIATGAGAYAATSKDADKNKMSEWTKENYLDEAKESAIAKATSAPDQRNKEGELKDYFIQIKDAIEEIQKLVREDAEKKAPGYNATKVKSEFQEINRVIKILDEEEVSTEQIREYIWTLKGDMIRIYLSVIDTLAEEDHQKKTEKNVSLIKGFLKEIRIIFKDIKGTPYINQRKAEFYQVVTEAESRYRTNNKRVILLLRQERNKTPNRSLLRGIRPRRE